MPIRGRAVDSGLTLPPPYELLILREADDAFAHACAVAVERGAGAFAWVRRYDLAEFAVVLEPEQPLAEARRAFYVGMNALADALAFHAPPECPIAFDWPDAIRVDGVLIGGGRLGWPNQAAERQAPPWLVFSAMVRTVALHAGEPGKRPHAGALEEAGFQEIDAGEIVASFARHLMAGFHELGETGFPGAERRWIDRLHRERGARLRIADNGDLLVYRGAAKAPTERRELVQALAAPSWLDPTTGTPRL
jgi:hypothetical protein